MITVKKIICPTDFSEPSYGALEAANGLALQYSSELYLINIVEPVISDVMIGEFNYELYEKRLISAAKKSLKEVIEQRVSKKLQVHSIVRTGDPADEIVKIAAEKHADVIVIATHGRKGWKHLVFGSVAEKVIRLTSCPVLVIRAPHEKS